VGYRNTISSTTPTETLQENLKVIQPCDEVVGTRPAFVQRHCDRDEMSKDKDKFILSQSVVGSTERDGGYKYYKLSFNLF
jgi:hypothetical protein